MKRNILLYILGAAIIATGILWAGLEHDAMQEFCISHSANECQFDYLYAFGIWSSWFLLFVLPVIVVGMFVIFIRIRKRRR